MSLLADSLLKSLIKGLCVAIGYTHQMVALLVRRRILRIAFFKKKFRIPLQSFVGCTDSSRRLAVSRMMESFLQSMSSAHKLL